MASMSWGEQSVVAPTAILDENLLQALHWKRQGIKEGSIAFLLLDVQVRQDRTHGTCVVMFGRAEDGGSLCVTLHGWYPYLYVQAPPAWVDSLAYQDCLRLALSEALAFEVDGKEFLKRVLHQFAEPIVSIETVTATNILGYDPSQTKQLFLKQRVISPLLIQPLRDCWTHRTLSVEGKPTLVSGGASTPTFDANLDPILQFIVSKELCGCHWCQVPLRPVAEPSTYCDYELECHVDDLRVDTSRDDLGQLLVLSFDLEAAGRRGVFPDPAVDPVIQIAIHFLPKREPLLLSLKECNPIPGAIVLSFEKEQSLLLAFRDVVLRFDPDILTGYNICNFDFEYLQKRAEALEIGSKFALMTRVRPPKKAHDQRRGPEHMQVKECFFQSAQVSFIVKKGAVEA